MVLKATGLHNTCQFIFALFIVDFFYSLGGGGLNWGGGASTLPQDGVLYLRSTDNTIVLLIPR